MDISKFEIDSLLLIKNRKVIRLMKEELEQQIKKGFFALRAKRYSYLKEKNNENKNNKRHKKVYLENET